MRRAGRLVQGLVGAAAMLEIALPGPRSVPWAYLDPRHRQNQASECRSLQQPTSHSNDLLGRVPGNTEAIATYRDEVCAGPGPSLLLGE